VIGADPVASAVVTLVTARTLWTGSCGDLLAILQEMVGERVAKSRDWPSSAQKLSGRLRRAASFLREVGIVVRFERVGGLRLVHLSSSSKEKEGDAASEAAQAAHWSMEI